LKVHWTAASGLEGAEESERFRAAAPPGGTVAEERAKLVWAGSRLLNGNKSPVKRIKLLKGIIISLNPEAPSKKMGYASKDKASDGQSNPTSLNWILPGLFTKEQSRKRSCL
jgi:hypothetical protein